MSHQFFSTLLTQVASHATDEQINALAKALAFFLFRRLPLFLEGGYVPPDGLADLKFLGGLLGMTPDGVRKQQMDRNTPRYGPDNHINHRLRDVIDSMRNNGETNAEVTAS